MTVAIIDIETTGLDPLKNRIVAIGLGVIREDKLDIQLLTSKDEKELLTKFWGKVSEEGIEQLIGFNINKFDWQFIKLRSLYYRIRIKYFEKYEGRKDLMQILNGGGYIRGRSLKAYCEFFNIDIQNDDVDGCEIPQLWERYEKEDDKEALDKILHHLQLDIKRTYELYKILVDCGLIEE
ncbi:ribonuclease H-like domain-containing protein [Methanocaldococcus sp.]|uniref:ribonuclease H-like domain-containing protein n=1 Tax=Methanocaldococcus sp. TaxID=2152917 RepID=UPI0026320724|nr:ribonuclease H-like domain-containing protein [Methanocaldococcus sp.]MCQ6254734.1 ribonuclease H-like domain-containing protein [Methanocaldococcus sp.]